LSLNYEFFRIAAIAMNALRILMIEDNPWVGSILQDLIAEAAHAEIIVLRSVAAAEKALFKSKFDFAFLDVNVTDGKTYAIAAALMKDEIPFAFMSGFVSRQDVPENLRKAPFLAKPFQPAQIKSILSGLAA
jgi:DNA-binding NtrC family response regulator